MFKERWTKFLIRIFILLQVVHAMVLRVFCCACQPMVSLGTRVQNFTYVVDISGAWLVFLFACLVWGQHIGLESIIFKHAEWNHSIMKTSPVPRKPSREVKFTLHPDFFLSGHLWKEIKKRPGSENISLLLYPGTIAWYEIRLAVRMVRTGLSLMCFFYKSR